MKTNQTTKQKLFSPYQVFIIAISSIIQFCIVLDFMVLSPLGALLIEKMHISPSQFSLVVSAYAWSAGISGIIAAAFADKFDRKKFLLFFYFGFIAGTVMCAVAPTYEFLLIARIVTGTFGGVIGSIGFAIISDLFKLEVRGRVMGFVQMSFGASQVLGLPVGLILATRLGWHSPFWMIAGFATAVGIVIILYMKPMTAHLKIRSDQRNPFHHLQKTLSMRPYQRAFLATMFLATGGFMLMPLGSAFSTKNLGIHMDDLWILYGITGLSAFIAGPLIGKLSDKTGKYKVFVAGSLISMAMVLIYTNLGVTPLWFLVVLNVILFAGITSRIISSSTLLTAVPEPQDRGAFMSVNSSVQQLAGGAASAAAGLLVSEGANGKLLHYSRLGYVVTTTIIITMILMFFLNRYVQQKNARAGTAAQPGELQLATE